MSIETQQELAGDFVREVVARFGIDATTKVRRTEDDGIHISVEGENLGLLVGPKGATVEALQELTRTVVQRHTEEHTSRIVVDVGGYRERRAAALRQFVAEAAADVLRTGAARSARADVAVGPEDRARHGQRARGSGDDLRGRRASALRRHPPGLSVLAQSCRRRTATDNRSEEPADLS